MTKTTSSADSADRDMPDQHGTARHSAAQQNAAQQNAAQQNAAHQSADQHRTPSSVRFGQLPERIRPEDMVATQETEAPPEPTMGRDTERDFILRNAGF